MLRGANRQEIFHDEEDACRFLEILDKYKSISELEVYAWCIMGNHVHLLLKEGKEDLSITMKRIGVSYAWYYNKKYMATGHLFQDRYKSENVESDGYLVAVVRYIHQNPVKAGLVKKPSEWKWSSCRGYYGKGYFPPFLLDSELVLGIFKEFKATISVKEFVEYNEIENKDKYLDNDIKIKLTDNEARVEIRKAIDGYEIANIKSLPKAIRDEKVKRIKEIDGLTQRQISRMLGIPLSLINRA